MKAQIPNPKTQIPTLACVVLALLLVSGFSRTGLAQEGHPLAGTWHGTWSSDPKKINDVTLVLEYDGTAVKGMMNPGPDAIRFDKITLDPATWSVRFEARSAATKTPIVIDVKIEDVTNRRRSLVGTFTDGSTKGDFKASRDD
jgi:hypothetical protein